MACHAGSGVTDVDGNTYGTIMLGTQEWTMSNLNVATYRNGDPIPQVQDFATWQDLTTGAWCYYENNSANGPTVTKVLPARTAPNATAGPAMRCVLTRPEA